MKIRRGFVSNSSSTYFVCHECKKLFEIDDMGNEYTIEPEYEGICIYCSKKTKKAVCEMCEKYPVGKKDKTKLYPLSELIKLEKYGERSRYLCAKHWLENSSYSQKWLKKVKNPNYVMNKKDIMIAQLISLSLEEIEHAKESSEGESESKKSK